MRGAYDLAAQHEDSPAQELFLQRTQRIQFWRTDLGASTASVGVGSAERGFFLMGANGGGNTKREVTPGFVVQRRTYFPISCHLVVERARTRSCQFLSPPGLPLEKRPIQPFLPSLAKGCFENRAGHNADYLQPSKLPFFISTRPSWGACKLPNAPLKIVRSFVLRISHMVEGLYIDPYTTFIYQRPNKTIYKNKTKQQRSVSLYNTL
jgi:hypothetical protein